MIGWKAPGNYSASIWYNNFLKLFMTSWFVDVFRPLKTNSFYLSRHQDTSNKSRTVLGIFIYKKVLYESRNFRTHIRNNFRTDGHRQIPNTRLITAWKSWIWGGNVPENVKWKFGKFLKRRKPKPRNQETFLFSSKGIPSPFHILAPTLAPDHLLGDTSELPVILPIFVWHDF